jgi:hypothetical protein
MQPQPYTQLARRTFRKIVSVHAVFAAACCQKVTLLNEDVVVKAEAPNLLAVALLVVEQW